MSAQLIPPILALLAGVSPRVVAVANEPSPGGSAVLPARATSRSRRVGGGPGTLSLQLTLLHNFMLRCCPAEQTRLES